MKTRNHFAEVGMDTNAEFDVRKSVHHHTIQIIQPTRCNSFTGLLLDVYVWLNRFRAPPRPSSGAYNCINSLRFYRWSVVVAVLLVVVWPVNRPDHDQFCSVHRMIGDFYQICSIKHYRGKGSGIAGFVITTING